MITAKKFIQQNAPCSLEGFMIEFAKLHVTEALKQVSRAELDDVELMPEANDFEEARELSILNAYPLENIK